MSEQGCPDWVPMWLRTAMGRKCGDMLRRAELVEFEGISGAFVSFGPVAWRVADGVGGTPEPIGRTIGPARRSISGRRFREGPVVPVVEFLDVVGRHSCFNSRVVESVEREWPEVKWLLTPMLSSYFLVGYASTAVDPNVLAIVAPMGDLVVDRVRASKTYDVSCLASAPTLQATSGGPMAEFKFVHPSYVPELGETFLVAGTMWRATDNPHQRGTNWAYAHLAANGDPKLAKDRNYCVKTVEVVIALVVDAFNYARNQTWLRLQYTRWCATSS